MPTTSTFFLAEADIERIADRVAAKLTILINGHQLVSQRPAPDSAVLTPLRLRPKDMAQRLNISQRTLREWARKRIIPFERIGPPRGRSIILFDVAAVDRALQRWRSKAVGD
jgi:excisionase family DNA binding protein